MTPIVSVVVTTKDRPVLAERAIRSVLGQTIPDIEIVVVDDGSSEKFDFVHPQVRVLRNTTSAGVCEARNMGLAAATGRWILFLDDDDILLPDALERCRAAVESSDLPPPVASLGGMEGRDASGKTVYVNLPVTLPKGSHYFLESSLSRSFQVHNTLFAPREVVEQIGGFDPRLKAWVHDEFFLRLNAACSLQGIPEVIYLMSVHTGERLSKNLLERARSMELTERLHREIFKSYPVKRSKWLCTTSTTYLRAGAWRQAIETAVDAVVAAPSSGRAWRQITLALAGPSVRRLLRPEAR